MSNWITAWKFLNSDGAAHPSGQQLFDDLVTTYSADLYRYAYWLCGERHTAEDLVQETLLRAWKALDRLKQPRAVKGWLLTILRHENARRFERYQPRMSTIPLDELGSQERSYDTSIEAFALRQAMRELPEEYREPLMLQVIGGYSQKEIARFLKLSPAGVGTRLFRARRKLRLMLAPESSAITSRPAESGEVLIDPSMA